MPALVPLRMSLQGFALPAVKRSVEAKERESVQSFVQATGSRWLDPAFEHNAEVVFESPLSHHNLSPGRRRGFFMVVESPEFDQLRESGLEVARRSGRS